MGLSEEVWKDVKGYEGLYQVSTLGRIKTCSGRFKGRIRKLKVDRHGYECVALVKHGVRKDHLVHRLVAQAFIPNPENKPQVNHIDENPLNNCLYNLEWVTAAENANHGTRGYRIGLKQSRPVKVIDIATGEYNNYKSMKEASEKLGLNMGSMYKVLSNKMRQTGGYVIEYAK